MSSPATSVTHDLPATAAEPSALRRLLGPIDRGAAWGARGCVAVYRRLLSPLLPPACRFYPTCSCYADEALERHGFVRGGVYTAWRVARCHPFSEGGLDPVPAANGVDP